MRQVCRWYSVLGKACGWEQADRWGRQRREAVRLRAAELFAQNIKPPEVARRPRVSLKSAHSPWCSRRPPDGRAHVLHHLQTAADHTAAIAKAVPHAKDLL
ncbi:hypothetical protein GCM10010357_22430 [Streptomyces luteireticuli]|uniref:Transposase n=1 Tax=Streptomyces luteireticuli TaxID=173858 RepID=A0ABN0YME6_9ACTN